MKDPPRLLDEGADAFERSLLASASRDIGSTRLLRRTLAAAGVAATGALAATASGKAAASASSGAAATSGAGAAGALAKAEMIALLKWILGGALAGVVTIGAYEYALPAPETKAIASAPAIVPSTPPAPAEERGARAESMDAPREEEARGATREPPRAAGPAPSRGSVAARPADSGADPGSEARAPEAVAKPSPQASSPIEIEPSLASAPAAGSPPGRASSLTAQIASLDQARKAISARDPARALRELDRHRAEFPAGVLGPEATVLRIEALVLSGQRASAQALADQFLRSPANAAHATRIASLLRRSTNP